MKSCFRRILWSGVFAAAALFCASVGFAAEVNIYSARQEHLIKPLLDEFSKQTGVQYKLLTGEGPALLERLKAEGRNSPADVLLTVDVGNLVAAKQAGVLQAVKSSALNENIKESYRDAEGFWYGLSARARVIFYDPKRVKPEQIATYEALADPELGKVVCVRSSSNIYNQSLVAALIAHHGVEQVDRWIKGFVNNFARKPQDNDTAQIKAVASGECAVAVANSYYYARMLASGKPGDKDVTDKVAVLWPNQGDRGAHMNLSGAGVTASARNVEGAVKLLEFLSGEKAQEIYARENNEYPVNPKVKATGPVAEMGEFKADNLNLSEIEKYNAEAVRAMDRGGWN